jgi:sulfite exporter TauE/SafE
VGEIDIGAMFLLGLLGTGHCLGMCGPIVLAVPASSGRLLPQLTYNLGRITTYTAVGGILGALGAGLTALSPGATSETMVDLNRVRLIVTLVAAILMVAFGLARLGAIPEPAFMSGSSPTKVPGFGRLLARARSGRSTALTNLAFGLLMGLLPCGMSYGVFARALAADGAANGALLVLAFGIGTFPGLLVLGSAASRLARKHIRVSNLLSGTLLIGIAVWIGVKAALAL